MDPRATLTGQVIDGFEIGERFASGGFGIVYLAKHLATQLYCAAKVIDLSSQSEEAFDCIMREISVFMQIQHRSMTTFFRVSVHETLLIFFSEFIPGGTVLRYVQEQRGLSEEECRRLFFQLYGVVRYLNLHHFVVHRDIKLTNCMIDGDGNLRLIDFGLCATTYCNTLKGFVGSAGYSAPEVLLGVEYSEKCDVFSLGICLYTMRHGLPPFRAAPHDSLLLVSMIEQLRFGCEFSDQMMDLIRKMIAPKQSERIELLDIANHPWMAGFPQTTTSPIVPRPIIFFKVQKIADILKFRRKFVMVDSSVLKESCEFLGIDEDKLSRELSQGLITDETTVYYLMSKPCTEQPQLPSQTEPTTPVPRTTRGPRRKIASAGDASKYSGHLLSPRMQSGLPPKIRIPEPPRKRPTALMKVNRS
jgi:serine/threonine protein kinase